MKKLEKENLLIVYSSIQFNIKIGIVFSNLYKGQFTSHFHCFWEKQEVKMHLGKQEAKRLNPGNHLSFLLAGKCHCNHGFLKGEIWKYSLRYVVPKFLPVVSSENGCLVRQFPEEPFLQWVIQDSQERLGILKQWKEDGDIFKLKVSHLKPSLLQQQDQVLLLRVFKVFFKF